MYGMRYRLISANSEIRRERKKPLCAPCVLKRSGREICSYLRPSGYIRARLLQKQQFLILSFELVKVNLPGTAG
jgi:hypothetical protein